jgi:hypothetical protein
MEVSVVERKAKGANFASLVRALKAHRKKSPLGPMPSSAQAMLDDERIIDSEWYPFQPLVELLRVLYRDLLGSNDAITLKMGILEGKNALQTWHTMFVMENDPLGSALAMRHSWRTYFNFGELKAEQTSSSEVTLTLSGYPDVQVFHANMILGWAVAAAQLGGAPKATGELVEKPWLTGARTLVYRVKV